ncbi:hypothetical protein GKQ38_05365 [Candidatus Nanohaloarchaea archaeon]|nr:hypothetical protein GKQ38_05365 [Candidatus Nanohaloarchaea archaeon]
MRSEVRNLLTEDSIEELEAWFEGDFSKGLKKYVAEAYDSPLDNYDFHVETLKDEADLRYNLSDSNGMTDIHVEASGGDLAANSAINAFDELWKESPFYDTADQS